jgi:hypothetical protein
MGTYASGTLPIERGVFRVEHKQEQDVPCGTLQSCYKREREKRCKKKVNKACWGLDKD